MQPPILISGYGWVSPLGNDATTFDDNLFSGHCAVTTKRVELRGQEAIDIAVAPCDFDHSKVLSPSKVPLDRGSAMAIRAAQDALVKAGLAHFSPNGAFTMTMNSLITQPERVGVFWGSGMGGAFTFDQTAEQTYLHQKRIRPTNVITTMPCSASAELALLIQAQGACLTFSSACASSSVAIGEAMNALRSGRLDVALVGGSEAMLTQGVLSSWNALRVLAPAVEAPRACRPFNKDRNGFVLGEGAGAFVLETLEHAKARQASRPLNHQIFLNGYATNCDASHMTNPNPAGQARVMQSALKDAGFTADQIEYVNAHATGTTLGDAAEVHSVGEVFGAKPLISSTKAQFGHLLGAGGALELIATLRGLERGMVPPNANLDTPEESFKLNFVGRTGIDSPVRYVLTNSFAFGGTNASLVASLDKH